MLINHNVLWFEVSMHYSTLVMEVLEPNCNLFHNSADVRSICWVNVSFLLDVLSQTHFHLLEHDKQPLVVVLNPFCLHYIRAMLIALVHIVKLHQDLDFS